GTVWDLDTVEVANNPSADDDVLSASDLLSDDSDDLTDDQLTGAQLSDEASGHSAFDSLDALQLPSASLDDLLLG
ncbi:MAG: hypothetical protein OIF35_11060, partial [Cellvibrionaceae bacterium]|nr:hypothetical protein [Cellvibrionaceae bacterium]